MQEGGASNAYNQSVGSQEPQEYAGKVKCTGTKELPAKARRLYEGLYDNTKEAEFGS